MSNILILLNSCSNNKLLQGTSPFIFLKKDAAKDAFTQHLLFYETPEFIILEENPQHREGDIKIITELKANPVFASAPLLILTSKQNAEETLIYFEHGATTCLLKPAAAGEWLNIINNIPAYWQEAA